MLYLDRMHVNKAIKNDNSNMCAALSKGTKSFNGLFVFSTLLKPKRSDKKMSSLIGLELLRVLRHERLLLDYS